MTDPAPSHVDLDGLADALAGEIDAVAAAHLASCASCTSRLAELEAAEARVRAALAALPAPEMPAELAARLDAAVAAERPLAAASSVTALPARRTRRTWMPAAAAAVLLVSGGGLGYALLSGTGSDGGDDSASTAADAGGGAGQLLTSASASGTDYADAAAVQGVLPAVLAGVTAPVAVAEAQPPAGAVAGGTTAEQSQGPDQESRAAPAPAPMDAMVAADPLARLRTPEGLADCLGALLPPEEPDLRPRALDYALFEGGPALAVLLPDPDPSKLSVYVVGPGCSRKNDSLLTFFRVPAP